MTVLVPLYDLTPPTTRSPQSHPSPYLKANDLRRLSPPLSCCPSLYKGTTGPFRKS